MRTLNRPLSLLLALVMVLSLGVTGVSAASSFTDVADSEHKEAVEIGEAIGLIAGDKDANGNVTFNPDKVVTRAQAAAFITRIMGMPDEQVLAMNLKSSYTDMDNYDWAQPYVAYCEREGIIAGVGGGRYAPGKDLTGYQFCRLLLAVLGYKFEASTWQIETAKLTQNLNLASGVDGYQADAGVTRDTVAQLMYNSLTKNMVVATASTTVNTGDGTSITVNQGGEAYRDRVNSEGTNGDYRTGTTASRDNILQLVENSFKNLKRETQTDDFGNPTEVWRLKGVDVGTYDRKTPALTYTANLNNSDGRATIKADISGYSNYDKTEANKRAALWINGIRVNNSTTNNSGTYDLATTGDLTTVVNERQLSQLTGRGRTVKLYVDTDTTSIETIVVNDTFIAEVSSVDDAKGELTLTLNPAVGEYPTIPAAGITGITTTKGYGQFKKNDKVLVTLTTSPTTNNKPTAAADIKIQTVAAAKAVTGKASSKTGTSIILDGTSYPLSYRAIQSGKDGALDLLNPDLTNDATLYLDENGYFLYAKPGSVSTDAKAIGVLEQYQTLVGGKIVTMVKGVTVDGKTVEFNTGANSPVNDGSVGEIYTWDLSNGIYTLTPAESSTGDASAGKVVALASATPGEIAKNASVINVNGKRDAYFSADVKFIYMKKIDNSANDTRFRGTVVNGVQAVKSYRENKIYVALNEDNSGKLYVSAVYLLDEPAPGTSESASGLLFVKERDKNAVMKGKTASGEQNIFGFEAWLDGVKQNPFWSDSDEASAGFYRVSTDSEYTNATVYRLDDPYDTTSGDLAVEVGKDTDAGVTVGEIFTRSGASTIRLNGGDLTSVRVNDSTKFVDADGDDTTNMTSLGQLETAVDAGKTVTVYVIFNANTNTASHVYITEVK